MLSAGVTFDYESPIAATNTKDMDTYIALVKATREQMCVLAVAFGQWPGGDRNVAAADV